MTLKHEFAQSFQVYYISFTQILGISNQHYLELTLTF